MPAAKYPFDSWFAQGKVVLVKGRDYHCSNASFISQLRSAASKRGMALRIAEIGEVITVLSAPKHERKTLYH